MAAKGRSWLGEFWRPLAALLLWVLGMVPLIAAPPLLPSLAETRVGGVTAFPVDCIPAAPLYPSDLHRVCGPPLDEVASGSPVAAKSGENFVNLASPQRTTHILTGDATGGGHLFPGAPGKSPFPQGWSGDRVMHEISDVATDPASLVSAGRGGRSVVTGTRDGVDITVILESQKKGGGIVTGFPTNVPRNPP